MKNLSTVHAKAESYYNHLIKKFNYNETVPANFKLIRRLTPIEISSIKIRSEEREFELSIGIELRTNTAYVYIFKTTTPYVTFGGLKQNFKKPILLTISFFKKNNSNKVFTKFIPKAIDDEKFFVVFEAIYAEISTLNNSLIADKISDE